MRFVQSSAATWPSEPGTARPRTPGALLADEVEGSNLLNLDIGLPVDELCKAIRAVISGSSDGEEQRVEAINRRGRTIECVMTITPLRDAKYVIGAILVTDS